MASHLIHLPVPVLPKEGPPPVRPPLRVPPKGAAAPAGDSFVNAILETPFSKNGHVNPLDWAVSLVLHAIFIAVLIITPLYFTEAIDLKAFTQTFLVGPPPPAPPPPAAAPVIEKITHKPVPRLLQAGRLSVPTVIPKEIAMLKEEPLPPETEGVGVIGGVPGGIPGGQAGGVLGGIIGAAGRAGAGLANLPPPPVKRIVRVGGDIKPPRLVYQPELIYPPLARVAKTSGVVRIEAVIDEQGNVVEARAVEGPGLLIAAALKTVSEWRYEPTLLNGQPVSVRLTVFVKYELQ